MGSVTVLVGTSATGAADLDPWSKSTSDVVCAKDALITKVNSNIYFAFIFYIIKKKTPIEFNNPFTEIHRTNKFDSLTPTFSLLITQFGKVLRQIIANLISWDRKSI